MAERRAAWWRGLVRSPPSDSEPTSRTEGLGPMAQGERRPSGRGVQEAGAGPLTGLPWGPGTVDVASMSVERRGEGWRRRARPGVVGSWTAGGGSVLRQGRRAGGGRTASGGAGGEREERENEPTAWIRTGCDHGGLRRRPTPAGEKRKGGNGAGAGRG